MNIVANDPNLLGSIRELFSRLSESRYRESWELQHLLFSLGYCDSLAPEGEIAAAMEVARTDWTPDEGAT